MDATKKIDANLIAGYRQVYCASIIEYFSVLPTVLKEIPYKNRKGKDGVMMRTMPNPNPPTFAGWRVSVGALEEEVAAWREAYPDFERAYRMAEQIYDHYIQCSGMTTMISSGTFAHITKNKLGWTDERKLDVKGTGIVIYLPARDKKDANNK